MKSYEIMAALSDSQAAPIFEFLYATEKPAYKACLTLLASRRKLRPVVLERKSRADRNVWLRAELARKSNEDASIEILQTWILGDCKQMVCHFLDTLKIPHDGNGILESLPPDPGAGLLGQAIDDLLAKYSPTAVAVYLNLFVEMDIADWPSLHDALQTNPALCLTAQPAA